MEPTQVLFKNAKIHGFTEPERKDLLIRIGFTLDTRSTLTITASSKPLLALNLILNDAHVDITAVDEGEEAHALVSAYE
jgi:hypothetical protein